MSDIREWPAQCVHPIEIMTVDGKDHGFIMRVYGFRSMYLVDEPMSFGTNRRYETQALTLEQIQGHYEAYSELSSSADKAHWWGRCYEQAEGLYHTEPKVIG